MIRQIVDAARPKMDKAVLHLEDELRGLRTGRANVGLVDGLMVESYGSLQPLKAVASVNTPDARTIAITPWDKSLMPVIEKVIRESATLGLTPNNDGSVIRLNIPPMTEERRREIVKSLGQKVEECRISLRNARHEALADAKRLEKDKEATSDEVVTTEKELGKLIDQYQAKIETIAAAKEREILEV